MRDTHPSIEEEFIKMIMKKSGEERIKMGCDMNETAKRLVIASVFQKNLSSSEDDIKIAILDRFYGSELSPEMKKEFIRKICLKLDT
ncbi:MAG: hypothetical protein Q8K51_15260 [Nitrospirota bacterium]|nr:hypothetical protein [Nitrospirota bacterium]